VHQAQRFRRARLLTPPCGRREEIDVIEIDIQGRRGQGAEIACQLLARAFARRGASVQTLTVYDGADRQAPVSASLRVEESPIPRRGVSEHARDRIVLDPALLAAMPLDRAGGMVLVNSPSSPCSRALGAARIVAVDAAAIASGVALGAAIAGAFAGATGLLSIEDLVAAMAEAGRPGRTPESVEAARLAYREAAETAGREASLAS
jgi:2-oxoacid:acceptor oxidoreductase gamma subunit (pyruvate/2-ketoisovalerate family)